MSKLDKIDFKKVKKFDSIIHLAPEVVGQNEHKCTHYDVSSDIWSIGVLTYMLLNKQIYNTYNLLKIVAHDVRKTPRKI